MALFYAFPYLPPLYIDHSASLHTSKLRALNICSQYWKVNLKGATICHGKLVVLCVSIVSQTFFQGISNIDAYYA